MQAHGWRIFSNTPKGHPVAFRKGYRLREFQVKSTLGGKWRLRVFQGMRTIRTRYTTFNVRSYQWVDCPLFESPLALALWFDRCLVPLMNAQDALTESRRLIATSADYPF